ncbi:MAG: hypothetical protein IJW14_03860 [Oscillospiraceae bacterium]|nr:hypothetical protein [Oscillospiraceae bacterium]
MSISYRTRRNLRRTGKFLLIFAAVAAVVWLCWMVWVARYMVYHRDLGAQLDFSLGAFPEGVVAVPNTDTIDVTIHYKEPVTDDTPSEIEKTSIQGYYIDFEDLKDDARFADVQAILDTLPAGTAVMFDVKNPKGLFYYSTGIDDEDDDKFTYETLAPRFDALIEELAQRELHLIARLPAFRDYWFGRYHVPSGLPEKGKDGALWMDNGYYWLNPAAEETLNYLVRITKELQSLGFDEVVYDDFRFPDTNKIVFDGDKELTISQAAATLATACATEQLCVSFMAASPAFPLPAGNCRVYLQGVAAEEADTVAQQVATDEPALHVLFITTASDASDTRFSKYCILRPIESAH